MKNLALFAMALTAALAPAQRVMVSPSYVANAVAHGVGVEAESVTVLSSVMALESEPKLIVGATERLDAQRSRVQLRCKDAAACLPFYALINAPLAKKTVNRPQAALMKTGAHVVLVFDDSRMHVQVPVIALEAGAIGKAIRVASVDHRHTWKAEVVSAGVVRGSL